MKQIIVDILPCQPIYGYGAMAQDYYSYLCPDHLRGMAVTGQLCLMPFGNKQLLGCVRDAPYETDKEFNFTLKPIDAILPLPPLSVDNIDFLHKFADYNMVAIGHLLKMMLSPALTLGDKHLYQTHYQLNTDSDADHSAITMTKLRKNFMVSAQKLPSLPLAELATQTATSPAAIKKMLALGLVKSHIVKNQPARQMIDVDFSPSTLSDEQQIAWQEMQVGLAQQQSILLDGQTGSGKTALYLEAVATTLRQQQQVLILLPEIALTTQIIQHFAKRFGCQPLLWHSAQSEAQKRSIWQTALAGDMCCVMGARSSLLLPFRNLGLIVVDEEHDTSYKQTEGVIYHARDMAVLRASLQNLPVILASATPSLESMVNAEKNRYRHIILKNRYGGVKLPKVSLVDLRKTSIAKNHFISTPIIEQLQQVLARKEQAILFLNRRGFAPLLLCRACGYRFMCEACDAWLVAHHQLNRLECHHCGHRQGLPDTCPECASDDLLPCGPGIERIAEEAQELFPDARIQLMSSDSGNQGTKKLVDAMQNRQIDILIGTQILSKGYHFSHLSFVGVIDADLSLAGGDLRAGERTYQMLYQVMGRAGREIDGQIILQTTHPEHILFQSLCQYDRDAFYQAEKSLRLQGQWPPYGRMAMVILQSKQQDKLQDFAKQMKRTIPPAKDITILGPALAPLARVNYHWQMRFLLRTHRNFRLQDFMRDWLSKTTKPSHIQLKIDIDPL